MAKHGKAFQKHYSEISFFFREQQLMIQTISMQQIFLISTCEQHQHYYQTDDLKITIHFQKKNFPRKIWERE